jgi:tetratricopeptide (TPR) repeat protein
LRNSIHLRLMIAGILISAGLGLNSCSKEKSSYTGSASCRSCHEKFYQLWSSSFHGLALQPYTEELGKKQLSPQAKPMAIGKADYQADIEGKTGYVREKGPDGEKKYEIRYVMGGKNVFYFLTPMDKGRLQVLPLAYDVNRKQWYDTTASHLRHSLERRDQALDWREWPLTFNTLCYNCHVSQLSANYDLKTDTYRTAWAEPGINCETCHGPAAEHIKVFEKAPPGKVPEDMKTIRWKNFSPEQKNDACSPCHAKMRPITPSFTPGDRYFDHFDLTTLEDPDFYPEGRDLGENFTLTLWRMSPCVKSGKLDCIHCHTSSGRYRFKKDEVANNACLPCHSERVNNAPAHTKHPAGSPGSKCISCHMPMTEFAFMRRSDHSMLPPAPTMTILLKSPNACSLCHKDRDAQWADTWVRKWRSRDYQAPVLYRAGLIDAARKGDWSRLPEMLRYLTAKNRDEIVAASLLRLLQGCGREEKWPAILQALKDPSPLVRSAAAAALATYATPRSQEALLEAAGDDFRLVRVNAAMALSRIPGLTLQAEGQKKLEKATEEYLASLQSRPDLWSSHYNLGNYHLNRGQLTLAMAAYETALKLEPRSIPTLVKASMAQARMGNGEKAESFLRKALEVDPGNAEANFNLGLLRGEQKNFSEAEKQLRAALKADPQMAEAAYNLGVLLGKDRLDEAVQFCRKAYELRPENPKYGYTLALYLNQKGDLTGAARVLQETLFRQPGYVDACLLLGEIYTRQGQKEKAAGLYVQALRSKSLPESDRARIGVKLQELAASKNKK